MISLVKKYAPTLYGFLNGFFSALNNRPGGQSLRKWLSIGFFWLMCSLCVKYTDTSNLISVITVISSMITALIITNTAGNYYEKKLDKPKDDTTTPGSEAVG